MQKQIIVSLVIAIIFGVVSCVTSPVMPDLTNLNADEPCPPGIINFKRGILPIISSNCAFSGCHDAITAEEDVVLDTYENIMKEVTPNKPNNSPLYEYLLASADDIMPPPEYEPLSTAQIQLVKDWINQGAMNVECGGCDTATVTFSTTVYPIVENQCLVCHNDTRQDGNVNLATYDLIKTSVNSGQFMGSIEHRQGYAKMPPAGIKIDQCFIDQLNIWINDGMPNN